MKHRVSGNKIIGLYSCVSVHVNDLMFTNHKPIIQVFQLIKILRAGSGFIDIRYAHTYMYTGRHADTHKQTATQRVGLYFLSK